jgi:serine/threonine-protein kinase RsbW
MQLPAESPVIVTAPARPEMVHVLRAVASSVAARLDFPYDDIDDLRISIDEACAQLLTVGGEDDTLTLRLSTAKGGIEAVVSLDGDARATWPPSSLEDSLAWRVLTGLSDDVHFESLPTGPAIRILKVPTGSAGAS